MPVKAAPPAPVYDWNGFYIGGYYGTSIEQSRATSSANAGAVELNDTGISGGVTLGYNWQFSPIGLIGIEGDVGYLGTKRSFQDVSDSDTFVGVKSTWYSTVRGRLGYVTGPSLLYVTGGGAWVRLEETFGGSAGVAPTTVKTTDGGWTVGGGIETKLSRGWTSKTEYLFVDLGSHSFGTVTTGGANEVATFKNQFHVIKTGLNYKFGEPFELPFLLAPLSSPERWAGFYAGVNAGGGLSLVHTPNQTIVGTQDGEVDVNGGGFAGGGQIGYNWVAFSNWIVGLEGDIGYLGIRHSSADWRNHAPPFQYETGISTDWYGTIRGRIGTTTGPAFLYTTGGAAFVHFKDSVNVGAATYSAEKTKAGWTFGGGIETELTPRWSARIEGLYIDLGKETVTNPIGNSTEFKNRFQVIRAGLNYRFGGPDVVTARY
jgi:outer membrane immunogenic protein